MDNEVKKALYRKNSVANGKIKSSAITMTWFLIQYANSDNPKELVTAEEYAEIERDAEEFDGFTAVRIITSFTEADIKSIKQYLANVDL